MGLFSKAKIRGICSNRGGEFTSKEFNEFCEKHGIRCLLTVPISAQQNGVVERENRTILNMARCMLNAKNMPKEFWAEAVACAVYLSNISLPNKECQRSNTTRSMEWSEAKS